MNFQLSTVVNRGSIRWIVLAAFMLATIFGATAIASAELSGTETEFYNNTTEIDNSTTEIEVTVNGTNGSNVYANFYRVADSGNETLESEDMILNAAAGNQTNATWAVETNQTSAYRVVVHDNDDGLNASEVGDIHVSALSAGGGAGFLYSDDGSYNLPVIGLIIVVLVALILKWDDDS